MRSNRRCRSIRTMPMQSPCAKRSRARCGWSGTNLRRLVQPYLLQNCATMGCHNGTPAAKWNMVLPAESDAATYTNFLRMEKYVKHFKQSDDAVFGTGDAKMIDRQRPEKSLLLQYSL